MRLDYTDEDTERVRQAELSSAGLQTQQLHLPPTPSGAAGALTADRRPSSTGIALIGFGVVLLLLRLFTIPIEATGAMVLLTIASCFFFFGFWKRLYGLIIPGGILTGLSVGVAFAEITSGVSVLWGLALGFLSIYAIGKSMFGMRSQWPIFPAVPLFAVGMIVAFSTMPSFLAGGLIWLPLLLIGAGLYLGWGRTA
jgi:hypothetical protein